MANRGYFVKSDKLRWFRLRQRLTQQKRAIKSNLSITQVSRIERGHQVPHFSTIERIARVLKVSPEELIGSPEELIVEEDGVKEAEQEESISTRYLVQAVASDQELSNPKAYSESIERLLNQGDTEGLRLVHIIEAARLGATIVVWDTAPVTV